MTRFLIVASFSSGTAHGINQAFAVEASNSAKGKKLIEDYVQRTYSGTVQKFDRALNIANMSLNRYHYRSWEYINFSSADL